jgi:hypothetical protein
MLLARRNDSLGLASAKVCAYPVDIPWLDPRFFDEAMLRVNR